MDSSPQNLENADFGPVLYAGKFCCGPTFPSIGASETVGIGEQFVTKVIIDAVLQTDVGVWFALGEWNGKNLKYLRRSDLMSSFMVPVLYLEMSGSKSSD